MNMIFYNSDIEGDKIKITGDDYKHLTVLRVLKNDVYDISDNKNYIYTGTISEITGKYIEFTIMSKREIKETLKPKITLYQAVCKKDKNEYIIQKATELGVSEIVFFYSRNCVAVYDGKSENKILRYEKTAKAAAMQSGRELIPKIRGFYKFEEIVSEFSSSSCSLFFYEFAEQSFSEFAFNNIAQRKDNLKSLSFVIGSEGGFDEKEVDVIINNNIPVLSLGSRILRADTASVCVLSVLSACLGEF